MPTELTLDDVYNYLNNSQNKVTSNEGCQTEHIHISDDTKKYTMEDVDIFLLAQAENATNHNTSSTTKDNFLELYKKQYSRNLEAFVGILIISAILAKMMYFPTKV